MDEMDPVVDQGNDEELIKPELKLDSPRWYEGHISLEDAKTFIKANITTAARSFIAIGFYLKCVRDRELFREEEYPDVWEFAKSEYGISKSTASRYMSMNDRFSEGGNSPNIRDEYRAFGKSQLQEMLYLEDDQLEQVKPGDRVEDIRNLRKPKEVPYIELPGQLEFEIDFPEILPQEQLAQPMISQKQTFEMNVEDLLSDEGQEAIAISQQKNDGDNDSIPCDSCQHELGLDGGNECETCNDFEEFEKKQDPEEVQELSKSVTKHFFDRNENASTGDAYGWIRSEVVKEYLRTGYKGPEREYEIAVYGDEYRVVRGTDVTVFYDCSGADRPAAVTFDVENTRLEREYNFFFGNKEESESKEPEEELEDLPQPGFYNPDDDSLVDESYSLANIPRASDRHVTMFARLFVQDNTGMLFHGGVFYGITDERIINMLKLYYPHEIIVIDNDVEVSVGAEIIEFSRGDEDLGICLFQKFANYVRKQIDEYVEQMAEKERQETAQEQQPENNQGRNTFNTAPTGCLYRTGYSCTLPEANKTLPGDGSNCGSSCCWSCAFRGMCKYECNASAVRDGEVPGYEAAWFVREWAKCSPGDLKRVLEACRRGSTNAERAKAVQEEISPYGAHNRSCWKYDFSFHGFAGGIDFRIGKVEIHLKYGRFVQELLNLYPDFVVPEAGEHETVIEERETVQEQAKSVPESPETVIDGEFVEVPPEPEITEYTPQYFLEEQKEKLDKYLRVMERAEMKPADVKFLECQKTIVAALACMVAELERPELEPEPVKQEQPELPILKNNDQRKDFIDSYTSWPIWIDQKETGERYYRYDLSEKVAMVVKVNWKHAWGSCKESKDCEYGAEHYYLLGIKYEWHNGKNTYKKDDTRTFYECSTNMTALVEYLKDFQKNK